MEAYDHCRKNRFRPLKACVRLHPTPTMAARSLVQAALMLPHDGNRSTTLPLKPAEASSGTTLPLDGASARARLMERLTDRSGLYGPDGKTTSIPPLACNNLELMSSVAVAPSSANISSTKRRSQNGHSCVASTTDPNHSNPSSASPRAAIHRHRTRTS